MSIAESLRRQRSTFPVNPKNPPSILHTRSAASKISLRDQAALTLNSLSLLSTVDERIPQFSDALLLDNPIPRQNLPKSSQQTLSSATVSLARHLSPIFPVRHAQRLYEWLVNPLHVGLFGTDDEIDALLLSALPFHSTPQFPIFVSAVFSPRPRSHWIWLKPIVEKRQIASFSFLVKYCPFHVHRLSIHWASQLTKQEIPNTFATCFIANVTARAIGHLQPLHRRSIVLISLQTISSILSSSTEIESQQVKNLICALFIVISSALTAGLQKSIASAIANATIATIIQFPKDDDIVTSAFGTLALTFRRHGYSCLPADSAQNLIKNHKADLVVKKVGDMAQSLYCNLIRAAVFLDEIESEKGFAITVSALDTVKEAFFGQGKQFITNEFITEIVAKLLNLCISLSENNDHKVQGDNVDNEEEDDDDDEGGDGHDDENDDHTDDSDDTVVEQNKELYDKLVEFLTPLARGRFATAVDLGLRKHFEDRTKMKNQNKKKRMKAKNDWRRYQFVDNVLSTALHGTSFEIIKSHTGETRAMSDGLTMLSALDHPEPSVRCHALQRLIEAYRNVDINNIVKAQKQQLSQEVQEKILYIVKMDNSSRVSVAGCECAITWVNAFDDTQALLHTVGKRILNAMSWKSPLAKRSQVIVEHARECFVKLCETGRILNKHLTDVFTLLIGVITFDDNVWLSKDKDLSKRATKLLIQCLKKSINKTKSSESTSSSNQDKKDKNDVDFENNPSSLNPPSIANLIARHATSSTISKILDSLMQWKSVWGLKIIDMWTDVAKQLGEETKNSKKKLSQNFTIIQHLTSASLDALSKFDDASEKSAFSKFVIRACRTYSAVSMNKTNNETYSSSFWRLAASKLSVKSCGEVLSVLFRTIGESNTLNLLKHVYMNGNEKNRVQVVSFKWFIFLVTTQTEQDNVNDKQKNTIRKQDEHAILTDLVTACYGENSLIRNEAKQFCVDIQNPSSSSSSSPLSPSPSSLLSHLANVSLFCEAMCRPVEQTMSASQSKHGATSLANLLSSKLNDLVLKPLVDQLDIPPPLRTDHKEFNDKVDVSATIFRKVVQNPMRPKQIIPFLRAVHNHPFNKDRFGKYLPSLCTSLKITLTGLRNPDKRIHVEAAARLLILLANFNYLQLEKNETQNLIEQVTESLKETFSDKSDENNNNADNDKTNNIAAFQAILIAAGVLLLQSKGSSTSTVLQKEFTSVVIALSSRSSVIGTFARDIVNQCLGSIFPFDCIQDALQKLSNSLKGELKRRKVVTTEEENKDVENEIEKEVESSDDEMIIGKGENAKRNKEKMSPVNSVSYGIGALESVRRWSTTTHSKSFIKNVPVGIVHKSLWEIVTIGTTEMNKRDDSRLDEQQEFFLYLTLDSIRSLYQNGFSSKCPSEQVVMKVLVDLLFYGDKSEDADENQMESALVLTMRKSALQLVEVLAPLHGKKLFNIASHVISSLLKAKDLSRASESLEILIPSILKTGKNFNAISKWLCEAAFTSTKKANERAALRDVVASCCQMASNADSAVGLCIKQLVQLCSKDMSNEVIGRECSHLLNAANLTVNQDVNVITKSTKTIRCYFASDFLMNTTFVSKLFDFMTKSNISQEEKSGLLKSYARMLMALAECAQKETEKDNSLGMAFGILPLSGLASCFQTVMMMNGNIKKKTDMLLSFALRLDDYDAPLLPDWDSSDEEIVDKERVPTTSKKQFVESASKCIGDVLKSNETISMKQAATICTENFIKRFGAVDRSTCMTLASHVMELLEQSMKYVFKNQKKNHNNDSNVHFETHCQFISVTLRCLSTVVMTFDTQAVGIIPHLIDVAVSLIEWAFGAGSKNTNNHNPNHNNGSLNATVVTVAESALTSCMSIIESAPAFFGHKSLHRLVRLVLRNETKVLEQVIRVAMQELPSGSVVSAVSSAVVELGKKEENRACVNGIAIVLDSLRNGLSTMKKSEIKVETTAILDITFKCLEYGRDGEEIGEDIVDGTSSNVNNKNKNIDNTQNNNDMVMTGLKMVDDKCGDLLTSLSLRLPESEFKILFDKLADWCERGHIPGELVKAFKKIGQGFEIHDNLLRAAPFYRLCIKLFDKLEGIMVPYMMQLIDNVMTIIELPNVGKEFMNDDNTIPKKSKKRSRANMEEETIRNTCNRFTRLQYQVQDLCLNNLTKMLNHLDEQEQEQINSSSTVTKILDGLLCCFDERDGNCENVTNALCALGVRMCAMRGTDGSREESRELVNSMARQVLQRTKENDAGLRRGALVTARAIALAVGDEYLVTLPETLPVLAEVIDDEDVDVQKAAKAFVSVMESLAGEPIMDELNK